MPSSTGWQAPALHVPPRQPWPQEPQLLASVPETLTHWLLQICVPAGLLVRSAQVPSAEPVTELAQPWQLSVQLAGTADRIAAVGGRALVARRAGRPRRLHTRATGATTARAGGAGHAARAGGAGRPARAVVPAVPPATPPVPICRRRRRCRPCRLARGPRCRPDRPSRCRPRPLRHHAASVAEPQPVAQTAAIPIPTINFKSLLMFGNHIPRRFGGQRSRGPVSRRATAGIPPSHLCAGSDCITLMGART